jgi:hypothetical protein
MNGKENDKGPAPQKEKYYHNGQGKKRRHAAVRAAEKEKSNGKQNITKDNNQNPDAEYIKAEIVDELGTGILSVIECHI